MMSYARLFCLSLFLGAFLQAPAHGHGVEWFAPKVQTHAIALKYSSGEPLAYASFKVFAPSDRKIEFLSGNADKNGVVVFTVTEPGEWLVSANDGLGHKIEVPVVLSTDPASKDETKGGNEAGTYVPVSLRALIGLSLLGNIYCLYFWWMNRKKRAVQA